MPPAPTITICPRCRYRVLAGIERCSECGASRIEFAAIMSSRDRRLMKAIVGLAAWPWVVHAMLLGLLGIARVQLGRWPERWGADDPKSIPVVRSLILPIDLALLSVVPAALLCLWAMGALAHRRAKSTGVGPLPPIWPLALLAFGVWVGGAAFLRWDPADALVWFMD